MFADVLAKLSLPPGGNEVTVAPATVEFASRTRNFIDSVTGNSYFGPNQPMQPQAPPGTLPRAFDYQWGSNLWTQPREEEPDLPSFGQLRALVRNCDLLRIIIEGRKKQVRKIPWSFRVRRNPGERHDSVKQRSLVNPNVQILKKAFERPDRQLPWDSWLSQLLEEMYVTDAIAIWPMYVGGKVAGLNQIDGAMIKPLHDSQAWRPNPPNPSYQQIVKGMPALNMTSGFCDQCRMAMQLGVDRKKHKDGTHPCNPLIYYISNPRVNSFYGHPPVEWILRTIQLAINRQISQISYYTEGNVPEMIIQAPADWTPEQILYFQTLINDDAGNIGKRKQIKVVPETKGITTTKDAMLKDELDEWLARVICFAYQISPNPFIKMSRGTAQIATEAAAEEGTIPELNFIRGLINYMVEYFFFIEDVEFTWNLTEESDGLKRMRIDTGYVKSGIIGVDETREMRGLDPIGVGNVVATATAILPMVPGAGVDVDDISTDEGELLGDENQRS